ncbi:MAG: glycosyltransferase family 2 protein [Opitutales bacterium]|jgi:glycosyltransferase involved in cell wall biosynthesis|nr:glycosyltransferase family 2 protein [Opitutales bacterium]MDP4642904.1 glycosyltransferase family 2 protein [Opitutales bacterium]MDP4776592.1 glycosyltransferase family 2 protein [Opitutales bacterium]MDP4879057.1 glycosyltransferase family 2 protein [Opitutales bacterium]MDP4882753.1 glycosyltransferase family 2 protein [Opitutales bacterium]
MSNITNQKAPPSISFVIPVYNEEETVAELYKRIAEVMEKSGNAQFKVYYIDDGSTDGSWSAIEALCESEPEHCTGLRFRRNFGKAEALQVGFSKATGDIIFTLDADLQDDPNEIPAFLNKLDEGYDLVSGWKKVRHDPLNKTLPSKVFNGLARAASGVQLHDFNCGFKAYRREVTQDIKLFGELHRFVPILAHAEGYSVGEIAVQHHPREHGVSKYGSKRFLKGLLDLITVVVTSRYLRRPAHLFGGTGFLAGFIGFVTLAWLSFSKMFFGTEIGGRPLFFLGILLLLLGAQLVSLGLIAEMITRQDKSDTDKHVAQTLNL